jgi:subtilisin family serine protease
MTPLDLVRLAPLLECSQGKPEIRIGLVDGPVAMDHPDLATENIQVLSGHWQGVCVSAESAACLHGTFVAGILSARRGSAAPAICPGCTLLIRPIFSETTSMNGALPSASPQELALALFDCIEANAQVINISASLARPSATEERALTEALDYAARRGVIVVSAAGNQGTLGSTPITRHLWVIPVIAYDLDGRPMAQSNLGNSIGRRGLGAPGERITSLGARGKPLTLGGTSAAAPIVSGTMALLWSEFPGATAAALKFAVTQAVAARRTTVVPPLLDAWAAYQIMAKTPS